MTLVITKASEGALHLDWVRESIAREARTIPGKQALLGLAPMDSVGALEDHQKRLRSWSQVVEQEGRAIPSGLPDPVPMLSRLEVEGLVLEPLALRALSLSLAACDGLGRRLRSLDSELFTEWGEAMEALPRWDSWILNLKDWIEESGRIADQASPELASIRAERAKQAQRLQKHLERLMRSLAKGGDLQDAFVTERAGRMVIPVRASTAKSQRGIVHATSSTGATLFVEPLEVVEANNERSALREAEQAEIERLLRQWSDGLRAVLPRVVAALRQLQSFDLLEAFQAWGIAHQATLPTMDSESNFYLKDFKHPMLTGRDFDVVPLNLHWPSEQPLLVISGPNAGGKTVVLKSLGLAAWLAHSGAPVPAKEARIPPLRQLGADIGDPQSMAADLSTFSGHMRVAAETLTALTPPAMFLFDELGSGTDPDEGAALAKACLEAMVQVSGIRIAVSTHYGAIKSWAAGREDVLDAAMEFDDVHLRPTYKLKPGETGVSAGFSIARRMGVPASVVQTAEAGLDETRKEMADTLTRLRQQERQKQDELEALKKERDAEAQARSRRQSQEAHEHQRMREELKKTLDAEIKIFRKQGRDWIRQLSNQKAKEKAARELSRAEAALSARARGVAKPEAPKQGEVLTQPPQVGDRVYVDALGREATVRSIEDSKVEIQSGAFTMSLDWETLRTPQKSDGAHGSNSSKRTSSASEAWNRGDGGDTLPLEVSLIGQRVDPALNQLDRTIDQALLTGHQELRIVHGHGTGRLKKAVREYLRDHTGIQSFRPGNKDEGGDGATMAKLR